MKGSVPASVDTPKPGRKGQALVQPARPITPALLSIPDTASMLAVTEAAVRRRLFERRLPLVKIGRLSRIPTLS